MNITVPSYHENPTDSQLIVVLTGSPAEMKARLKSILAEFDSPYGKPCQGGVSSYKCESSVIAPVWNGKQY